MQEVDPYVITPEDEETIQRFLQLYLRVPQRTWMETLWRGVQVAKPPTDLWVYQEILMEKEPTLILETGTFSGGSARFLADMCDLRGSGSVITVDVTPMGWARTADHPRIEFLIGSSLEEPVLSHMRREASRHSRVMVILDSLHTEDHVYQELCKYSPLVSPGQYLVVEDTTTHGYPLKAIERFLSEEQGKSFSVDHSRDKFFLSFCTGGFLLKGEI